MGRSHVLVGTPSQVPLVPATCGGLLCQAASVRPIHSWGGTPRAKGGRGSPLGPQYLAEANALSVGTLSLFSEAPVSKRGTQGRGCAEVVLA